MKKFRKCPLSLCILLSTALVLIASFVYGEKFPIDLLLNVPDYISVGLLQKEETVSENGLVMTNNGTLSMNGLPNISGDDNYPVEPKIREYQLVDADYFDDAVFIGDSRTDGLARYSGLNDATFYAKNSLTIYHFFTKKFIQVEGQKEKLTLDEALQLKQYGKVYIMFGINELGSGSAEKFAAEYFRVLNRIRELQPNAIIFVQSIMRVTEEKSENDPVYNNENINIRNQILETIDNQYDVFYLEMNHAVCDENGNLNAEYTYDGVHLKASYYHLWVDYLKQHGIIPGL